ncbi:hypothetical protein S83_030590 [Arachis hypogaea]|uniref:DEVIL-like protein n=1 Tax=Arachis hypogaea TaxID=3818 RepID=A0A445BCP7_ARAHY|nr:hypothetical protein Ahy_A09g041415 isoform A [Arachis hypogaea]
MKQLEDNDDKGLCNRHVCEPLRSFGRRCNRLVKEQRARFYIFRRCITMLLCWQD